MGKYVLQIAVQVGLIWLLVNAAAIGYLALSYWFNSAFKQSSVHWPLRLVKGSSK